MFRNFMLFRSSNIRVIHQLTIIGGLLIALMSIGCCGPMGCGPGCGTGSCFDCDGTAVAPLPNGPLDGLRNFKRSLVCGGGGCGETYIGEWISTPPDACDPCCGDQFVGGASKCRPFCWQPGSLLGGLNMYGQRFCDGNVSSSSCGCGVASCDGGCGIGGDYFEGGYGGEVISHGGSGGGCGCASCSARSGGNAQFARSSGAPISQRTTQVARQQQPIAQQVRTARADARVDRIRR